MNKKTEYFIPGFEDKIREAKENDRLEEMESEKTATITPIPDKKMEEVTEVEESTPEIAVDVENIEIPAVEAVEEELAVEPQPDVTSEDEVALEETIIPTDTEVPTEEIIEEEIIEESQPEVAIGIKNIEPVEAISVFTSPTSLDQQTIEELLSADDLEYDEDTEAIEVETTHDANVIDLTTDEPTVMTTQGPTEIPTNPTMDDNTIHSREQKKNRGLIIGLLSLLAILVLGGGIASYFVFFQKTKIDPFEYISLELEGVSGNATPYISINEDALTGKNMDEVTRLTDFLSDLNFEFSKDENVENGDLLSITVLDSDKAFSEYRFSPESISQTFEITGLSSIPASWNDVQDKTGIDIKVGEQLQATIDLYKRELNTIAQRDLGRSIDITIEQTLQSTSYMVNLASCTGTETALSPQMQCGTVAFVYKVDFVIPSNYQFTGDSTLYQTVFVSNIFDTGDTTNFSAYSNMLSSDYTGKDLDKILEKLQQSGFNQV